MEIINRRQRIFSISRKFRREDKKVGFVPTMGALHAGHLKLVEECRQRSDVTIVSIFVNPTQFNDKADLEKYPRDLTQDAAMLAELGVDYIYAPDVEEVYPPGFSTYVDVEGLTGLMEGASRPGHFRGVATVVTILFNTIRPDIAFFGQKDAQQVAVIERLTRDLGFEMEIAVVPTVREPSGLAMSSRNERLSDEERAKAVVLYNSLREAKRAFDKGQRNAADLAQIVDNAIEEEPAAVLDYVSIVDRETLQPVEKIGDNETLIAAAIRIGDVRLIDNLILNQKQ
ncbi:MAG: pantoate--beta-alanine ligase [Acidobacteria bacterium ACB1]|nr:Pantothenate synthetase [Pyrinomonadaceae bacterium]MCE7962984.1 pantoate--beta-alanine ligase [Acidobacteria bacterium ACB1]RIJ95457.1 MAG: pantoate--beta-alanine ligase [Acidobacteriota bacterium]